jgi:23S rRNA pseudouridine1911/1915/1917 synthase
MNKEPIQEKHAITILYEDNHLLILNKPAGLLTQPSPTNSDSLENRAKDFIKERDAKPGNVFLHAIHRLDSQASGIVLFAKSQKALLRLSTAIREQQFQKEYTAIVHSPSSPPLGTIITFLHHGSHRAEVVSSSHPLGKRSELVILSCEQYALDQWKLQIKLITGRYHQIRAQLSANGYPIIGDTKYGSSVYFSENAIALHHSKLTFPHPTLHKEICVESKPSFC